ncbi:MAG: TfoX/Sxy family protein [Syntrophales bacterium]|nr:TfoX/Sxy family protein [Syntrophales bacterium]
MPYDTLLEKKIEDITLSWDGLEKKKMFGGICYLINGNMSFGIWKDNLIVRMAPDLATDKLKDRNVKEFDITGKPMKGWVMVEKEAWKDKKMLVEWLDIGRSFALALPKKVKKKKSLEEIYYRTHR